MKKHLLGKKHKNIKQTGVLKSFPENTPKKFSKKDLQKSKNCDIVTNEITGSTFKCSGDLRKSNMVQKMNRNFWRKEL